MVEQSYLVTNDQGKVTSYIGPDATQLFRARMIRHGLIGWQKFKMKPSRGVTVTRMLEAAGKYTGKKYKTTQVTEAIDDMDVWVKTMLIALPVEGV
jgi:hypothetical protein